MGGNGKIEEKKTSARLEVYVIAMTCSEIAIKKASNFQKKNTTDKRAFSALHQQQDGKK